MPIRKPPVSSSIGIEIKPPDGITIEGDSTVTLNPDKEITIEDIKNNIRKIRIELDEIEYLVDVFTKYQK